MRQLTILTWMPPAAATALNEVWNDASLDLDDDDRAVLRRLASNPAMRDVWPKLPAEPAVGKEWVVRSALKYPSSGTFELRYVRRRPTDPEVLAEDLRRHPPLPTLGDANRSARGLVEAMQEIAPLASVEETWTRVRGDDCALDFKAALAVVEKLRQFFELVGQEHADRHDTLPTVARPRSKGARLQFFCMGMERQLRQAYGRPLYAVIAILAQVVFARPEAPDPDAVKKMCKRH
jgi:hypothetical protein